VVCLAILHHNNSIPLIGKTDGPFELSPERGRYALLYALAEKSFVSFIACNRHHLWHQMLLFERKLCLYFCTISLDFVIAGLFIGKYFNLAQFFSFLWISLFALGNVLLIRAVAIRLGAHSLAGVIAGIVFLFGDTVLCLCSHDVMSIMFRHFCFFYRSFTYPIYDSMVSACHLDTVRLFIHC